MEQKKFIIGHETGVIIIIGMIISFIVQWVDESSVEMLRFNEGIFFDVCLPLIIFASGYNLKRRKFFENIGNIEIFGILGTFLTWVFYSALTWCVF